MIRAIDTENIKDADNIGWRDGVTKVVINMGDAPPHDPEPFTGYTVASVVAAALAVDPAIIYPVVIGFDPTALSIFTTIAEGTGGEVINTPNASGVVSAIFTAIDKATSSPIPEAGGPYSGFVNTPVRFDASASFDPDGEIVLYEWDWNNDGVFDEASTSPTIDHAFDTVFSGMVRLRVADNDGLAAIDTADVVIEELPFVAVDIDVKPGTEVNPIQLKSKGNIPVAIMSTNIFDATSVIPNSVLFGPNKASIVHKHAHEEDVDNDGRVDLIMHFRTRETGIICGDTTVSLSGMTFDGQEIRGVDNITVMCK